ncbi:hypothetical protein Tco_0745268 [Tanacetum coccineum]
MYVCFSCPVGVVLLVKDCRMINLIMEYLVNISKRRTFWSLNEDILKINDSNYQYVVFIKEDTAYPCLHSPKSMKETSSIRRNLPSERRQLWSDLGMHKYVVRGFPWVLMGDFNVALNLEDSFSGSSTLNSAMYDFKACVNKIEVMDITSTGLHFTWNQKPKRCGGVLRNLDRIYDIIDFIDSFPGAYAIFQPYRISDHSHAVLKLPTLISPKPKPFKFFNFLAFKTRFIEVMESHWNT